MNAISFCSVLLGDRAAGWLLTEIPIAVTGSWVKDGHRFSITDEDLDSIVRNFEKRATGEVVVDFEHASERPEVARGGPVPAAAWINSLSLKANDKGEQVLWADLEWTPKAKAMVKSGEYRYFSPAIDWGAADKKTGRSKGATLTSGALTNHPFLEELPAIELSEKSGKVTDTLHVYDEHDGELGDEDLGDITKSEASERFAALGFGQRCAAVSRAIAKKHGDILGNFAQVESLADDHAIVTHDGKRHRVAYAVDADGNIRIGAPDKKFKMEQASEREMTMSDDTAVEILARLLDDGRQDREREISYHPSEEEEEQYHRSGGRMDRGGRAEAIKRAAKIGEPGNEDETEELRDGDGAALPRLRVRRMVSAGHHCVVDSDGKIRGLISHDDLTAAAREDGQGQATRQVMRKTDEAMKKNPKMTYAEAHTAVLLSDTRLAEAYRSEHRVVL